MLFRSGVPTTFQVPPAGALFVEHVYLKNGDTSETAVAGVSGRNMWAGERGDNVVNPMCTLVPTPRANPTDPELLTGIDLSGWIFHVTATGKVIGAVGPSLPADQIPTLGGGRKTVSGTFVDGPFNGPNDLCYHPTIPTIIFVADTFNNRICKVEETSPGVVVVTQYFAGGLSSPYSLYAESDGSLIVADRGNNRVVKISTGLVLTTIGTCDQPMIVRPFSDGNICVAEHGGTRRLLEMTRATGALRTIWLIRTPQGGQNQVWIWMDVDDHGTIGPVDDILTVDFSSYQTLHRVSRDGTTFSQFIERGSYLGQGALGLVSDPLGHYPWAIAISDRFAKFYSTGGGSSQIRQFRRVHGSDVTTVDGARYKRGYDVWNSVHDQTVPSLRLTAGLGGGHNFLGLTNVETLDAMSWDAFAAWARGGGNGQVPRTFTDAQLQDLKYYIKRNARRGLHEGTVDQIGHAAPVDPELPPPDPPQPNVTRTVAGDFTFVLQDVEDDPPVPDPPPDPPLPPPGEGDLDSGTWRQLVVPSRTLYQPRLIGDQNIAEGQPGEAQTIAPNGVAATGTIFRSFSGMVAGLGKAYSWGGGHAGHPGNCLDILTITTGHWDLQFASEAPAPYNPDHTPNATWRAIKGGGVGIGGLSPTGRPWVNHAYRLTAVDTTRDRLIVMSGNGLGAYKDGGWTQLSGKDKTLNEPGSTSAMGIIYDLERDSVWCFAGDTSNGLTRGIYEYTITTDTWRHVQPWPAFTGWSFSAKLIQAFVAPAHREVFLMCSPSGGTVPEFPQRLFRYSLDTGALVWETSLVGGTPQYEEQYSGSPLRWGRLVDVRAATNQLYCYVVPQTGQAAGFWIFTPAVGSGGTWQKLLTPDGPPLVWWTLCYDGQTDTFVGLRARTTYCGIPGAACGGIADTHLFTF